MGPTVRRLTLVLALLAAAGCHGQNPSYFPFLVPAGEGPHDPHAARLEVRPRQLTCPVRTRQVLIATVYDVHDQPRRQRQVEWRLEGAGHIAEVDEGTLLTGVGGKKDSRFAVSYTDYFEQTFTRGTDDPADDFTIRPGQTWCVLSSAQEGVTHVTVDAPGIANWDARQVAVTIHWVDTECVAPPPAVLRAGASHQLTTKVLRRSDRLPQANYRVRYRLLDGPAGRLLGPGGAASGDPSEAVTVSDTSGTAVVTLSQREARAGVNRVAVEVVRPASEPGGAEVVVARHETKLEWQAAQVALTLTGPDAAALGQEVPFALTVRSTGPVETSPLTVRQRVPPGWKFVRSEPPATPENDEVIWTLAGLPKDGQHAIRAVFVAAQQGAVTATAAVSSSDGLRAESRAPVSVAAAKLKLTIAGPATGAVGDPLTYQMTVTNAGTGPAADVVLRAGFDRELEHESKNNSLELPLGTLAPGQSRTEPLTLTAKQAGRPITRAVTVGAGGLKDQAEWATDVRPRAVGLTLGGPERVFADREATWDLKVTNGGAVPLANVLVRFHLPPEVEFRRAEAGGRHLPAEGAVVWYLGTLPPGESRPLALTGVARTATARALAGATASADGVPPQPAEHSLEIVGVPALALDVSPLGGAVAVGGAAAYAVRVTNRGTLTAGAVEVTVTAPDGLKPLRGRGPGEAKVEGQRLVFPAVESLPPGQAIEYVVEAQALAQGDQPVKVELRSRALAKPVEAVEVTRVLPASR